MSKSVDPESTPSQLQPWHRRLACAEAIDYSGINSFSAYLALEQEFIDDFYKRMLPDAIEGTRYDPQSDSYPYIDGINGNTSYLLPAPRIDPLGSILLIHGLTDSPYHLRAIAETLRAENYHVAVLRMPGHGTGPGGLRSAKWKDWDRAIQSAVRWLSGAFSPPGDRFYLGGYSTGGSLSLYYTFQALLKPNQDRRLPDGLLLFAPAIAVTPRAMLADFHKLISWIRPFASSKWERIAVEDDPFKYHSFPMNAADQIHLLTNKIAALYHAVAVRRSARQAMPPMLAFQTPVDATVRTWPLFDIFENIGTKNSELVLFDINRIYRKAIEREARDVLRTLGVRDEPFGPELFIATNVRRNGEPVGEVQLYIVHTHPGERYGDLQKLEGVKPLQWPENVFSLSHIAMMIAPEDAVYGQHSKRGAIAGGEILTGERDILTDVEQNTLVKRLRWNPLFDFMRHRMIEFVR